MRIGAFRLESMGGGGTSGIVFSRETDWSPTVSNSCKPCQAGTPFREEQTADEDHKWEGLSFAIAVHSSLIDKWE